MVLRAFSPMSSLSILIAYYLPVSILIPSLVLENAPLPRVDWMQYLPRILVQLYFFILRAMSAEIDCLDYLPRMELGSMISCGWEWWEV